MHGPESAWIRPSELIDALPDIKQRTIRSYLDRLKKLNIIVDMPLYHEGGRKDTWGGDFRMTKEGEAIVRNELDVLPFSYAVRKQ